jgi:hypothetical protein
MFPFLEIIFGIVFRGQVKRLDNTDLSIELRL